MDFHSVGFIPRLPPHTKHSDGNRHRSVFMCPHAARPRRLCQPPWTQPSLSENDRTLRRNQLRRKAHPKRQPLFGREGSGGEGKDSHSRQWRLSMAVFLNRNKRPQAAPIEVAELLSEKPPLPEPLLPFTVFPGGSAREGVFLKKDPLPRYLSILTFLRPLTCPRLRKRSLRRWRGRSSRCQWRGCS